MLKLFAKLDHTALSASKRGANKASGGTPEVAGPHTKQPTSQQTAILALTTLNFKPRSQK